MPLQILLQDITRTCCEGIVNPTDEHFSGSGGVDFAVHQAAGVELQAECARLEPLSVGEIAVTKAYRLPCRCLLHTVGPIWKGGAEKEEAQLRSCYRNALRQAQTLGLRSLAFPLISSGAFGFPKDRVLSIATETISEFFLTSPYEPEVLLCLPDRGAFSLPREAELRRFLAEKPRVGATAPMAKRRRAIPCEGICAAPCPSAPDDLAAWIKTQDDSFAVMLFKLIDRKGLTEVQCYKKANVSKGTFWKINNEPKYKPSKPTVLAFAIALELNMEETEQLLKTAGFSLSNSNTFDKIVQFYILNGNYDIFEINAALFQYDQPCLGC